VGHGVTVDACVEGLTDVVPHTEAFLLQYKQWDYSNGSITHRASGLCLGANQSSGLTDLQTCDGAATQQKWTYGSSDRSLRLGVAGGTTACLVTAATDTSMLRTNVTVDANACGSASARWSFDPLTGFVHNGAPCGGGSPCQAGLCLTARAEGIFNEGG